MGAVRHTAAVTVLDDAPTSLDGAPGKPIGTFAGLPLYATGGAPAHLRTRSQLERGLRLRPTASPVCYVKPTWHPDERRALFDPADTAAIPFRSLGEEWAWWARRTCPRCGQRREYVLDGKKQCGVCHRADLAKAEQRVQRTCSQCRRRGKKPYPLFSEAPWHQVRLCRFCVAARKRKLDAALTEAGTCPGGCGRRTAAKKMILAWAKANYRSVPQWQRRYCPPCGEVHRIEQERLQVEREARWEKQRAEQAERDQQAREARAAEVAELAAWAREALNDPNTVILDTETTGLEDDARIVDIAVVTSRGEVLLDTLVNPGEPIPHAATEIHGITDEMVVGAPTFAEILPKLTAAVHDKRTLIYNDSYDIGRLRHELALIDAGPDAWFTTHLHAEDAMIPYSDWVGDWNDYWGNYTWQRLDGGHRALGDCLAVIECLKAMAASARTEDEEVAA